MASLRLKSAPSSENDVYLCEECRNSFTWKWSGTTRPISRGGAQVV